MFEVPTLNPIKKNMFYLGRSRTKYKFTTMCVKIVPYDSFF